MKIAAFAVFILLLFPGCALLPTRTITVNVPVPVPCQMPDIPKPALPIDIVDPTDPNIFYVDRALWATLELLEGYIVQLQTAMAGCRQP